MFLAHPPLPLPSNHLQTHTHTHKDDRNGDGYISGLELWRLAHDNNMDLEDTEISALLHRFDEDGDGLVSCEEFDHFMDEYHSEMKEAEIDEILNEVRERLYKAAEERPRDTTLILAGESIRGGSFDDWHSIFDNFDEDLSGTIDQSEFHSGLTGWLGYSLTVHEAGLLMERFGGDEGNCIRYRDFARFMGQVKEQRPDLYHRQQSREDDASSGLNSLIVDKIISGIERFAEVGSPGRIEYSAVFEEFDEDGDGIIDRPEFSRGLEALGITNLSRRETLDIMEYFDHAGDGRITHARFCDFLEEHRSSS